MHIPSLHITQVQGQISIDQEHGGVEIEQPQAKVEMNINQPLLSIQRENSELQIDQSAALAAYGMMSPMQMSKRIIAAIPYNDIIAKMAQDGDRMAAVHQSDQVIPELAKEPPRELTELKYPSEASTLNVNLSYRPGDVHIDVEKGTVDLRVTPQKPRITRIPAQVEIGMHQYPSIHIEWTGRHIDFML